MTQRCVPSHPRSRFHGSVGSTTHPMASTAFCFMAPSLQDQRRTTDWQRGSRQAPCFTSSLPPSMLPCSRRLDVVRREPRSPDVRTASCCCCCCSCRCFLSSNRMAGLVRPVKLCKSILGRDDIIRLCLRRTCAPLIYFYIYELFCTPFLTIRATLASPSQEYMSKSSFHSHQSFLQQKQ